MTWDENASSIVMLMPIGGSGDDRCARYFPRSLDEIIRTGDFEISLADKVHEHSRTEVRKILVKRGDDERIVWHHAFLGWPDHGVPLGEDRLALLGLIKLSRYGLQPNMPRIVHCSAGVGRTGTFIALDYLLEELERKALDHDELELDPVFENVDYLREKRMMLVQGEAQYRLIYEILGWRLRDMKDVGEDIATNMDYTYVLGGPKKSEKKERWQGVPQRVKRRSIEGDRTLNGAVSKDCDDASGEHGRLSDWVDSERNGTEMLNAQGEMGLMKRAG